VTADIALVLLILAGAVILFVTEKLTVDLVAVLVLGALLIFGLVTPEEGISGLSNPATVTVAAMFVLSAGLQKSGALAGLGNSLNRLGGSSTVLLAVMMGTVGFVSAFINNTAAVAVFLPLLESVFQVVQTRKICLPLPHLLYLCAYILYNIYGDGTVLCGLYSNLKLNKLSYIFNPRIPLLE
jgi:di/tricarboxylate transporter